MKTIESSSPYATCMHQKDQDCSCYLTGRSCVGLETSFRGVETFSQDAEQRCPLYDLDFKPIIGRSLAERIHAINEIKNAAYFEPIELKDADKLKELCKGVNEIRYQVTESKNSVSGEVYLCHPQFGEMYVAGTSAEGRFMRKTRVRDECLVAGNRRELSFKIAATPKQMIGPISCRTRKLASALVKILNVPMREREK